MLYAFGKSLLWRVIRAIMDKIFNKEKTYYVLLLLCLIIAAEIAINIFHIPGWPMFCCMVFFILGEKDVKIIKEILIGSVFGILLVLSLHGTIVIFESVLGEFIIKIVFICIFIACIAFFHQVLPSIFNDYAFMFFIIGNLARVHENPFTIIAIDLIGGGLLIAGVYLIKKISSRSL